MTMDGWQYLYQFEEGKLTNMEIKRVFAIFNCNLMLVLVVVSNAPERMFVLLMVDEKGKCVSKSTSSWE